jgi:hypothetical protein
VEPRREKLIKNWDEDPQEYEIRSCLFFFAISHTYARTRRTIEEIFDGVYVLFAKTSIAGSELIDYSSSKHPRAAERNPHTVRDSGTAL